MGEPAMAIDAPPPIGPQAGPQTEFARCEADICVFGGGAGGGKSFALLYEAVKWSHVPGYRAVLFRRTSPELTGGGGLWDESHGSGLPGGTFYRTFGGRARGGHILDWRFEPDARIQFRHLQRESDRFAHQGQQYAFIGFDEATHFTASQVWYLFGRLRSTCGVRPYMRLTCNPDPDSFIATLIDWWIGEDGFPIPERAGVLRWFVRSGDEMRWFASEKEARLAAPDSMPRSLTFIPSLVTDNAALLAANPEYIGNLQALGRVERERLEKGNWRTRAAAGKVFKRDDFKIVDEPPSPPVATVRFWDRAASEPTKDHPDPDWTRGVRVSLCKDGELWVDDLISMQKRGTDVLREMRRAAESDGIHVTQGVWQDTGGAGKAEVDTTITALAGYVVEVVESFGVTLAGVDEHHRSSRPKQAFANAWAPWAERGSVYLKRASWTEEFRSECHGFPDAAHDDIVDAMSGAFQVLVGSGLGWWQAIQQAADTSKG